MVFSSLLFVFLFLSLNLAAYFFVGSTRNRNIILLVFSLVFYTWGGLRYLFLLLAMSFCSWLCAIMIQKTRILKERKMWMTIECAVLLGLLGIFKYVGFLLGNVQALTGFPKAVPEIILPIGISFYTFQLLSYVIDVYRKEVKAQPVYWKVLLYCSLFHQCIAGPIVRYQTVAEEIDSRKITLNDISEGIRRFCIGLAKKAILANSCAGMADSLLANTQTAPTAALWLGMLFYAFQIYLDFSAYSDMAIGMGRMVGFHYLENFNYPYIASSVQDFWRRWHISLSTFFRDYVYIPLGGNRQGTLFTVRNMFAVWFLTGMWHGASWNYILWGMYFFVFLMLERFVIKPAMEKVPAAVNHIYAMIVVYFGWVLFRFENMGELGSVLAGMFGIGDRTFSNMATWYALLNNLFLLIFCVAAVTPLGKIIRKICYQNADRLRKPAYVMYWIDALTPVVLLFLSLLALVGNSYNPFLYFQF